VSVIMRSKSSFSAPTDPHKPPPESNARAFNLSRLRLHFFLSLLFGYSFTSFYNHHLMPPFSHHSIHPGPGTAYRTRRGFTFVMPLGLWANLLLFLIALILLRTAGRPFFASWPQSCAPSVLFTPSRCCCLVRFLSLSWSNPPAPLSYDTGLYHAQNIRWIETYPLVPGLGNLHDSWPSIPIGSWFGLV